MSTYNDLNAHPRDTMISFDPDGHVYTVGGVEYRSVTTIVEDYFPKFDADLWAPRVAMREGVSPDVVRSRWEQNGRRARELGTRMHEKIERWYLGEDDGDSTDALRLFRMFAAQTRLHPFRSEWRIFDEEHSVAGTLDFLERTPGGVFNLWDWKRSTKLIDSAGMCVHRPGACTESGFYPLSNLPDLPYWHYAMQLNIYSYILERHYDIRVSKMRLGVFHPDYTRPYVLEIPPMRPHAEALLRHYSSKLSKVSCC